ncbi:hypothetical protein BCR41DRAFT_108242 [Lobosporangium transversale]|uniref:Uncharacterized protein n=1 Tax=Lobosporangium transversale TaxID=64571 RepID=A0A1Y2GMJ3_9FUNG|nr:hypothetical protein BCR41DRAFT_108242 [Lobosporangium transversale]ORZ11716.1 hypothetical protein BCR41DRAFT_108242 [Lobosporangium transversale]|eukprot:XP_021879813.1 hypothetical protein BCR41DRAFT_108242 [Lobosporangium transversale]
MNSASSYAFLPYPSTSQVTSPGLQHQNQPQQSQQPQQPQQKQQQQQQQHPLGPVTTQQQQQQQQQPQQPQQSQQSQQQQQQQQQQQDLTQDLSAPPTPLSLHPSLQTSSAGVSVSGSLAASPVSVSNNTLSNASGPTLASHGHPTINTAILTSYGNMLPSPQSSQVPSTPTTATLLPSTPPPHTADLDSILATYANQPELLKLIIASKTEEDRRWAEEARFKMMDLIMRGENRNLITGYEGLLGQVVPGPTAGTPTSTIPTGNMGTSPTTSTVATSTITTSTATIPTTTTTTSSALGLAVSGKRFMDNAFDSHSGAANSGNGSGGSNGFAQGADLALARKRSVTFARDVHHGHLRSQSMSSVPSLSSTGSTITASADQFGTLSMMGLTGPNTALQQQQQHHPHQIPSHPSLNQLAPFTLQQPFQQQHFQQHQSQQSNQMQQVAHQQLPPHFGQYPQPFPYHTMSQFQPQNVIRRTSSLSHLSHFAQNPHATVTEPRLAASRPRNDSASSFRTLDDSDDESDDGYNDHPVLGGMDG